MTGKADFTPEEWELVLEAPTSAGMMVVMADSGGFFRETFSMAKAYTEARKQHGESQLLDEVVNTKPKVDKDKRAHSFEELKTNALKQVGDAVALLKQKATPEEVEDYRRFVLGLAERVAKAHKEDGVEVSPAEETALSELSAAAGA